MGAAAAFAVLALLVAGGWAPLAERDAEAVRSATDFTRAHAAYRAWMRAVTEALQSEWTLLYGAAVALGCALRRRLADAAWLVLVVGLGGLTWPALKQLVDRPRPTVDRPLTEFTGLSFPSGHASSAAILCGALLVLAWPALRTKGRYAAVALAVALPLASGWSRLALGGHYPSDLAGGYLLGAAWVALGVAARGHARRRARRSARPAGRPSRSIGTVGPAS